MNDRLLRMDDILRSGGRSAQGRLAARLQRPFDWTSVWAMLCACLFDTGLIAGDITVDPVYLKVIEEANVPALREGAIVQVLIKEGDVVQPGAALIQIDDQLTRFRKEMAQIEYRIATKNALDKSGVQLAEAEIKVASASLKRALESRKRFPDTPSQAEVDELELRVAQARQHMDKASHDVELAELAKELAEKTLAGVTFELERHVIRSPILGAVVEIVGQQGDWVRPGELLVRVVRIDRLRAEGQIRRDSVQQGLVGGQVKLMIEGTGGITESHSGKVIFISPEIDPNDQGQRIVAEIDNSRGLLGPGLRGKMILRVP